MPYQLGVPSCHIIAMWWDGASDVVWWCSALWSYLKPMQGCHVFCLVARDGGRDGPANKVHLREPGATRSRPGRLQCSEHTQTQKLSSERPRIIACTICLAQVWLNLGGIWGEMWEIK